jgi:hypothetical protein
VHQAFLDSCNLIPKLVENHPNAKPPGTEDDDPNPNEDDDPNSNEDGDLPTYYGILESIKLVSLSVLIVTSLQQHLLAKDKKTLYSHRPTSAMEISEVLDTLQRIQIKPPRGKALPLVAYAKTMVI